MFLSVDGALGSLLTLMHGRSFLYAVRTQAHGRVPSGHWKTRRVQVATAEGGYFAKCTNGRAAAQQRFSTQVIALESTSCAAIPLA
jgi:hypothetical protein